METVVTPLKDFSKNSVRLVKRCTKPDRKGTFHSCQQTTAILKHEVLILGLGAEFNKICSKTALGFVVMGFIGFFVKLIFIVSPFLYLTSKNEYYRTL